MPDEGAPRLPQRAPTHDSIELVRQEVTDWIGRNWEPAITLEDWWRRLADAGYAFPHWPIGCGGLGADRSWSRVVLETLAERRVVGPPSGNAISMGVPTVLRHGTPAHQAEFVVPAARGRESWCQLFSEPGAGSDLASLSCSAVRDGDEFVINGQKVWNSGAESSEWGMLLARTNPDAPKHAGISWMMIDMRQPGVEVRPLRQMNGRAEFCEVFLTEARVPIAHVVGNIDEGWTVARTTLAHERGALGSRPPAGLVELRGGALNEHLQTPLGELIERADSIRQAARRLPVLMGTRTLNRLARDTDRADDPIVRQGLADYYAQSQTHRFTGSRARSNAMRGQAGPEGSIGKLTLAGLARRSRDLSMSVLGAQGMLLDDDGEPGEVQLTCLTSPAASIGGGTDEIQRNVVGERSLGLPREPSVGVDVPFRELRRAGSRSGLLASGETNDGPTGERRGAE